jgi:Na+/melibiose symporter-like transporter
VSYARYGALGLPLAFISIPLYVHVPAFYAAETRVGLATIGLILLAVRILDMVADPIIGSLSDRHPSGRKLIMALAVPLLAVSYFLLFTPPEVFGATATSWWLALTLVAVYAGYSALTINYYAMGVALAPSSHDHTRIALWREAAMLVGVLLASLLPPLLSGALDSKEAYRATGLVLALLLPLAAIATLTLPVERGRQPPVRARFIFPIGLLRMPRVRWALLVTFFNAFPVAVTSTLFLFFVADVLVAPAHSGPLLAVYFASAVIGMPFWSRLSRIYGKSSSILVAMLAAVVFFAWAGLLGAGDVLQFYAVCFLAGLTLGADTVLMPSLFADQLDGARDQSGAAFGWWHFLNKAALALAAGIALPLLAFGGYAPERVNSPGALALLSASYALLPCACKAFAAFILYLSPLHRLPTEGKRTEDTVPA